MGEDGGGDSGSGVGPCEFGILVSFDRRRETIVHLGREALTVYPFLAHPG